MPPPMPPDIAAPIAPIAPIAAPARPARRPVPAVTYATQDQIQALLYVIRSKSIRDHAIFTVGYWRGLRASEVGLLRLEDYRVESGRLYVHRLKGSNSGEYALSQSEIRTLSAWLRVRGSDPGPLFVSRQQCPLSRQQIHKMVRHYSQLAGWPDALRQWKVLRHSIATHLLMRGVDIYSVKDWLGHRSISSTEVYAKITNPVRKRAEAMAYSGDDGVDGVVGVDPGPQASLAAPHVKVRWKSDARGRKA